MHVKRRRMFVHIISYVHIHEIDYTIPAFNEP